MAGNDGRAVGFALRVGFRGGRCNLTLSGTAEPYTIKAHWTGNGFRHLVQAVEDLVDGRPAVSFRWADALGDGFFVDLTSRTADDVGVAVHRTSSDDPWSAERGECVFRASTALNTFVRAVASELHRIRVEDVDTTSGIPEGWSHPFPFAAAERIGDYATRWFGYRPLSPIELREAGRPRRPGPLLIGSNGNEL